MYVTFRFYYIRRRMFNRYKGTSGYSNRKILKLNILSLIIHFEFNNFHVYIEKSTFQAFRISKKFYTLMSFTVESIFLPYKLPIIPINLHRLIACNVCTLCVHMKFIMSNTQQDAYMVYTK